jgi:hypothetical protein
MPRSIKVAIMIDSNLPRQDLNCLSINSSPTLTLSLYFPFFVFVIVLFTTAKGAKTSTHQSPATFEPLNTTVQHKTKNNHGQPSANQED